MLRILYLEDKLGTTNIGKIYGVDKALVHDWLIFYDIPRWGMSESAKIRVDRQQKNPDGSDKVLDKESEYYMEMNDLVWLEEIGRCTKIW